MLFVLLLPHFWVGIALMIGTIGAAAGGQASAGALGPVLFWNLVVGVFVWHLAISPVLTWRKLKHGVAADAVVDFVDGGRRTATVAFHFPHRGAVVHATMSASASHANIVAGERVTAYFFERNPAGAVLGALTSWDVEGGAELAERTET